MKNSLHLEYRNKETGKTDPKIYHVIDDAVTINNDFKSQQYFNGIHSTIFKEIEIVDYRDVVSPEILMAAVAPRNKPMSEKTFFNGVIETLRNSIEKIWSPDKHHLIQHSSGWDSRIMSTIIRRIWEERGDEWLGDISFVAWGYETQLAGKIIEAEGWDSDLYFPVQKDEDYFKYGFDFSEAWRGLNGVSGFPVNNPNWAFEMLRKRDIIPQDLSRTQVWSASWFNEMFNAIMELGPPPFDKRYVKFYYYCVNAQYGAAFDFEFVQPLFNPESIKHFAEAKVEMRGTHYDARGRLVKHVDKNLTQFPRLPYKPLSVPPKHFERIKKEYRASWYGRSHPIDPRRTTREVRYNPWWSNWSAASLCEHLINSGVEINRN